MPMRHAHAESASGCPSRERPAKHIERQREGSQSMINAVAAAFLSRRHFLAGGGALIVSFSLLPQQLGAQGNDRAADAEPAKAPLPGSLKDEPMLDSWIRIDADGSVTVFTGKAELGQGIKTALIQVAAEELSVDFNRINLDRKRVLEGKRRDIGGGRR